MARKSHTARAALARRVAALAERQHGVVARRQLRRLGVGDDAIDRAAAAGRLHRVFRGVYAVGHRRIGRRGRMIAAALACGPGAAVSHRSAAALHGLIERGPTVVDVIASGQRGRGIDGIRAHRCRPLQPPDRASVAGIPCTSAPRTLVDLAGTVGTRTLSRAFEVAAYRQLLDLDAIEAILARGRRRGAPGLRVLLSAWRATGASLPVQPDLRSPFEARLLPLLATSRLPMPVVNAPVRTPGGRLEVDLLWPDQRFVVEADGRRHHGNDLAFERDRWRDRELLRAGYTTLRVSWRQVDSEPEAVLAAVRIRLSREAAR